MRIRKTASSAYIMPAIVTMMLSAIPIPGTLASTHAYPTVVKNASASPSSGCNNGNNTTGDQTISLTYPVTASPPYTASNTYPSLANRSYILHVPPGYTSASPLPLIFSLHGSGESDVEQRGLTNMNDTANNDNFIVAYLQGTDAQTSTDTSGQPNGPAGWDIYDPGEWAGSGKGAYQGVNDIGYLEQVRQQIESHRCIDTVKVALTGFSLGAGMVWHTLCVDPNSSWIHAIAPVNAPAPQAYSSCFSNHTPVLAFTGLYDIAFAPYWVVNLSVNYYTGSAVYTSTATYPSSPEWPAQYPYNNQGDKCNAYPSIWSDSSVFLQSFTNCGGTTIGTGSITNALWIANTGGHGWPGGNPNWLPGYTDPFGCFTNGYYPYNYTEGSTCHINASDYIAQFAISGTIAHP